jgi:hypothetical protein
MIRDKKTIDAIVAMLDRRIERLQKDQDEAREKRNANDQIEAGFRRQEATLIRQTIALGEF